MVGRFYLKTVAGLKSPETMLDEFIQVNGINAQILTFDEEVATCKQAQVLERSTPIVKTIVLAHAKGFALVILEASKKVDLRKVENTLDTKKARLATPEEVEHVTGYEVGGVPPISVYGTPTLIDEGVLTHTWVLCGGGNSFSLLKITAKEILAHAFEPQVVNVALC